MAGQSVQIHLDLTGDFKGWEDALRRYADRDGAGPMAPATNLEIAVAPKKGWTIPVQTESIQFEADTYGSPDKIYLARMDLTGTLEKKGGRFIGRFDVDGDDPETLIVVVRACMSILCEELNALFLHASGVRRNGKLWIFYGPSGVGKSTIARTLNGGGEPFSSDRVILRRNQGRDIWAYPTRLGDHDGVIGSPEPGPIAGTVLLEQSAAHAFRRLGTREALQSVLSESMILSKRTRVFDNVLKLVGDLVERKMCYKLSFKRDPLFWTLVDELVAGETR